MTQTIEWSSVPLKALFRRRDQTGQPDLPLLSVYRDFGVVPRAGREDNFNKASDDLGNYRIVHPGDLVINKMKTWQGSLGISGYYGIVSPAYIVCEQIGIADARFLHYLLRSRPLIAEYGARSKGIRPSQWDLPWSEFREIRVHLPASSVQERIATFLDNEAARIEALVEKKGQIIGLLEARRMSVMTDGVRGRFLDAPQVSSDLAWLDEHPGHWRKAKLTLAARLGSGHTPSRNHPEWWVDCTIPWITTGEVAQMRSDRIEFISKTREMISELGVANSSAEVHPAGTVVLRRTASAGYSAIMGRDMAASQDFATWTCGPLLRPRFLLLCLRVMRQDLLGRLAMGSTHQTIYMPDIESIRVPLPPVAEQDQIVDAVWDRLRPIDEAVDRLTSQMRLLTEYRQALITAAVTGELDVAGAA